MCASKLMRQSRLNREFGLFVAILIVAALTVSTSSLAFAEQAAESNLATLDEHLAAGEFALARQLVLANADQAARDTQLARIAAAQARAGGRSAALETVSLMHGDVARSDSLREVREGTGEYLAAAVGGALGGAGGANFGPLIQLIENTIEPDSWEGLGSIQPFFNGVYVDPEGVLRRHVEEDASGRLQRLHGDARADARLAGQQDARIASHLRKVSLPRLERLAQLSQAMGRPLDEEMLLLAGLQRIEYVLVYPESGDLVIAGPAGDWSTNAEGRVVSADSGQPVMRLDDLVAVWRVMSRPGATFGCTINPRQEALAATHAYLAESAKQPLKPGGRHDWLRQVQGKMGRQDIEVFDLDPHTRTARVLVEADYHMKLIGMGLVEGTAHVPSYLDLIEVPRGEAPPPLDVLRWWFTLNYKAVAATPGRGAYHLKGQGVRVQSENELLTAEGNRVATGKAEELNRRFAENFTKHFDDLAAKYPVYGELRNVFDLALSGALVTSERLADQAGWHQTYFGAQGSYPVPLAAAPASVETVVNHRLVNGKHVVAGISGGVHVAPASLVKRDAMQVDQTGSLDSQRARAMPAGDLPRDIWWWD